MIAPMPIDASTLDPDPIRQLGAWVDDAARAGAVLPNAFALATADDSGAPSVRFVLLRGLDAEGLRYYTYRGSRKGRDVAINPWASAAFWWPALERQARVSGSIRLLSEDESLAYWRTRPRGSQLSASASAQGQRRVAPNSRCLSRACRQYRTRCLWLRWAGTSSGRMSILDPARSLHYRVEYRRFGDGS